MKRIKHGAAVRYNCKFALDYASDDICQSSSVDVSNGIIVTMPYFTRLTDGGGFRGFIGRSGENLYLRSSNRLYRYANGNLHELAPISSGGFKSCSAEYRGKVYASISGLGTYEFNKDSFMPVATTVYDDFTACGERLFALRGNILYYSKTGDNVINDECDYVQLPTSCNAVTSLGGRIYVLGNVCYKIIPSADDTFFVIKDIGSGLGAVERKSIAIVGNRVIFATAGGLHCLVNDKITRIFRDMPNNFVFTNCCGTSYRSKYLLSLPDSVNRPTILLDIDEETCVAVLGRNMIETDCYDDKLYAIFYDGQFKGDECEYSDEMRYKVSNVDFGTKDVKYLRCARIKTDNALDIIITSETETRIRHIEGKNRVQRIPLCGKGYKFDVTLNNSKGKTEVELFELIAETFKESNYGDN